MHSRCLQSRLNPVRNSFDHQLHLRVLRCLSRSTPLTLLQVGFWHLLYHLQILVQWLWSCWWWWQPQLIVTMLISDQILNVDDCWLGPLNGIDWVITLMLNDQGRPHLGETTPWSQDPSTPSPLGNADADADADNDNKFLYIFAHLPKTIKNHLPQHWKPAERSSIPSAAAIDLQWTKHKSSARG